MIHLLNYYDNICYYNTYDNKALPSSEIQVKY